MIQRVTQKWLSLLLAVIMIVSVLPLNAFATTTDGSVTNYADFITYLKQLEVYADEYAAQIYGKDAGELVLNFIRTGVERYQDDNWNTLAGAEDTNFTSYVEAQDAAKGTSAMNLRNIVVDNFVIPNSNKTDFGHMFGCMNISYVAKGSADLSGWAGDICDLLQYSVANIDDIPQGSVDEMAAYIKEYCFGQNATGAYGWDDFYGDMDAYYLISEYKNANGSKKFSELMESYFKSDLNDTARTVYFMNNRFAVANSKDAVRKAIYDSYCNDIGISILEAKRGLTSYSVLRQACCYAFADYVFSQADGKLVEGSGGTETAANGYYTVFSDEESILAPGIKQNIKYAQTVDGKQIVYYIATLELERDDVDLVVNYNNNKAPTGNNIGLQTVMDQTAALVKNNKDKENFHPIVATNAAAYNITNGMPAGLVVMDGVEYSPIRAPGFFAVLKDGTALIGSEKEYAAHKNEIKDGVQAFGSVLVKDGKINVTKSANYTASRGSRTAVGITKNGEVVMMVLDGRQLPRSAGGALEETAQIMLEAGCVDAINLDGGGSTTYLSKPAGKDDIELLNVPSDGYQRRVATSLVAVSTAAPSTAFDSAIISSDYEYITAGTSMQFSVTGVSNTGNAAPIPEGAFWRVSDESVATINKDTGLFTAKKNGTATVEFVVNGAVKGNKVINVVTPDDIKFAEDRITAVYGVPKKIDITVWYQGYPVAFTPLKDAYVFFDYEFDSYGNPLLDFTSDAGVINGLEITGTDAKNVRSTYIYAALLIGNTIKGKQAIVSFYKPGEANFDFENATQGNRTLAWNREIENAKTADNQVYRISDPDSPVEIDYTFALDMTAIDFPAQLEPMKSMLPTYNENSTAWDYLLQLAERVCIQTNVTIRAEFSKDLEIDIEELKVVNEYFEATEIHLDENNVLTVVCTWKNQSQPIDPATANPLCILSGIKATVKDTAAYFDNKILIVNNGTVNYDIYLAAGSLHSFAEDPSNQAKFGIYPYIHEEDCRSDFSDNTVGGETGNETNNDRGAHFSSQYADFADTFLLNSEILNGWHQEDDGFRYYVNNEPLTGIQMVPDRTNKDQDRVYEFDETGKLVSEQGVNGLVTIGDDLYYAVLGVAQTGWQQIDGNNYYFHPDTNKAVDGVYTIREKMNPAVADGKTPMVEYTYTFTNHVLTLGQWVYDVNIYGATGWRYRWAGQWQHGWFEVQGEYYYAHKDYPNMVSTGYTSVYKQDEPNKYQYHLFDDTGRLQKEFSGHYLFEDTTYALLLNGVRQNKRGLYEANGYYYYVGDNGYLVKNLLVFMQEQHNPNALVPNGKSYQFDEFGRMTSLTPVTVEKNFDNTDYSVSVLGQGVTIKHNTPCKVGYYENDSYVAIKAIKNKDGSYNFSVPKDVKKVMVVQTGDANADGVTDAEDLTAFTAYLLSKTPLTDEEGKQAEAMFAADANGDGRVSVSDLARLNAILKGKAKVW